MKFTILTELKNEEIFEGMLIDYHISPILGIRLNWRTEITQVDYQKSFTDVQLKGPYKYWQHFHSFRSVEDGVVVTDLVDYALPFGFIGSLAHRLSVKNKLEKIFDYRMQVLDQKFNQ